MKRLLYILLFLPSLLMAQPDLVEAYEMGDEAARGKINASIQESDSMRNILNPTDSIITGLKYADFKTINGWSMQEGRVGWNDDDKTLEAGLDQGSVLQIGQEIHMRATNKTGAQIDDGSVVYVSGAQGNRPTIALASDTSAVAILTLGIATQDIGDNNVGYVTLIGLVRGFDTRNFRAGNVLWLGTTPGSMDTIRPDAPNTAVTLGVALNSTEDGIIAVRPVVVQRLSWLSDVDARDNQNDNNILVWRADSSEWETDSTLTSDSIATNAITYTDTYWDDLRVPLTNTRITPVNTEPDFEDRGDGMFAWGFDSDNDSSYVLNFTAQGPHERKDSTLEEAHIHWQPDGTNTGNVVWKLVYSISNVNGAWTTPDTLRVVDAADGVALKHQIIDFGSLIGSDTMRISHAIVGNVARMGDAPDDTYTGTAYGIELDFHYQIDSPGSEQEYIKN